MKEGIYVSGRFISTHSVALVLPMHIAYVPERGGSVHADAASSRPGGGFTTLCAAAAMGVPTAAASPLGTGPNSFAVRQLLVEAGVDVLTPELVGDIGVVIQLIVEDGSMRSVVTAGCWPVWIAYCSAGSPKASYPIGCSTLKPFSRL